MATRRTRPTVGPNAKAIATTIVAMIAAGKLDARADAARIATAKSLAAAVDSSPDNASLWREYRAAEAELHEVRDGATDEAAELTAALSAKVRDAPHTRAPHTRTAGSRGR